MNTFVQCSDDSGQEDVDASIEAPTDWVVVRSCQMIVEHFPFFFQCLQIL